MDLIPRPGRVVAAASSLALQVLHGGLAGLRFALVPRAHLGMLTGCAARRTARRNAPARRAASPIRRHTASRSTIGSNPDRRYGSASSRTLAQK